MPAISAAPTTWRPAFVGGPTLGSGLDASLLRKLQIAAYWLDRIYPGYVIDLVQGSPSGSSASGGTHAGPGDAADLEVLLNGKPAPTRVYVIASLILRLLGCIAWVRGQDVNGDGAKDDTFAAHLHVIDREGSQKVPAAAAQIMQYLAHQNGLIGGRTDYEVLVRDPLWLDTYTDAKFKARFMALTPAAAAIGAHIEPKDIDMMWFTDTDGTVHLANGERRTSTGSDVESRAVSKAIAGGKLTPQEIAAFDAVQERLRPSAVPLVKLAGTDTVNVVTADGVFPLTGSNQMTALEAMVDGGTATKDQLDIADAFLRQGPQLSTTVTATIDPAVVEAAVNDAVNTALSGVTFTTRKA